MSSWRVSLGFGLALLLSVGVRGADPTNALPRYTLTQALNRALEKNSEVLMARKKLAEAAGAIVEARAGFLPSLTSSGRFEELEAGYATLSDTIPNRRNELWSVAIRLTETLYAGGAVAGRMSIAKLNNESRWLEYQATVDRMLLETRIAFYDILRLRAQVAVHQQGIAFLDGELQYQQHRLALEAGDRLRTLRAEVSLALERAALVEAQNRLRASHLALSGLLDISYSIAQDQIPFEVDEEPIADPPAFDLQTCVARALDLRPEIKLRDNDISAQKKQLIVDRSALRPKVAAFAGYDVVNEPNAGATRSYYSGGLVGLSATWSLFDGFATKGKMNATRARLGQAELAREMAARAIQADVIRAFHDLAQAKEIIQTQRKNASLAMESLHLAQTNVALGTSTQLDLLQARMDLTRAQTAELTSRFNYHVALARLHRAISSRFTIQEESPIRNSGRDPRLDPLPDGAANSSPPTNYRPVTLAECYAQTLERNPEIRQKRLEVERAGGDKLVFTARALPRLALQGTAGVSDGTLYDSGGGYALARADVSQPLFDAGLPASLRRGNLEVVIAQQNLNRTVTEQLRATRLAYLNAVLSRRLLQTRRLVETNFQLNLRGAQQRFDAGMVDRQHVGQAEIQLLNLQSEMATLQRQYLAAVTELAECRGDELLIPGGLQLPEPRDNLEYAALKIDLTNETARTIKRRPDLVLLRALIKTATEDKRMVRSGYYPFVSLVAMSMFVPEAKVLLRRPEVVAGQEARETQTRYGAAFTWQVIDNGRLTGASRQIESARQALAITLRQLEENVPRELASLAHTLESVDAKLGALRQSAGQAEEALTLVEQRLKLGEATQLEFLNAQGNLLSTQDGLLQAVFENECARAEFDRLTGRYLEIGSRPAP